MDALEFSMMQASISHRLLTTMLIPRVLTLLLAIACAATVNAQPKAYIVEITDEIDLGLVPYIGRVIEQAEKNGGTVVLHVNTFGGRVDAATAIKDELLNATVPTIAFIDKRAISAGALISMSCRKIIMTDGATIGAATPVYGNGEKATEKVVSFMRSEMRSTAERNHRRADIAEAMVDEDAVLKDSIIDKPKGKLLTLTTEEARKVGYCDTTANTLAEALGTQGLSTSNMEQTGMAFGERAVRLLTNPIVSSLLIMLGLGGIFYVFKTGHVGWVAIAALGAFALFFGAAYVAKFATIIVVFMFLGGLFMLIVEIGTPIPTFGIAGIIGIVLTIGSLFLALGGALSAVNSTRALWILSSSLTGFIVLVYFMIKYLPKTMWWKKFILTHEENEAQGYSAAASLDRFMGKEGVAHTLLRPAGIADIEGERVDVVSEAEYINPGTKIVVTKVEGTRVVVRSRS
jgi:membrane-bound serine protease (ClpP class)